MASLRKQRAMRSLVAGLASSAIFLRETTHPASARAWDLRSLLAGKTRHGWGDRGKKQNKTKTAKTKYQINQVLPA